MWRLKVRSAGLANREYQYVLTAIITKSFSPDGFSVVYAYRPSFHLPDYHKKNKFDLHFHTSQMLHWAD